VMAWESRSATVLCIAAGLWIGGVLALVLS
jgi:hypothetical protein